MDGKNQVAFLIFIPIYVKRLVFLMYLLFFLKETDLFNVLFYNGGILYFFYNHLKLFFESVKDKNKLLKTVHSDLQIKSYLCGCRALGLINKLATGPLWRLLESGIHILDMNKHYQKMSSIFLFIC